MVLSRLNRIDHAWHIVGVGFLVSLMTTGIRFAVGPFMASITKSLSLTHTQFSTIIAVALLLYGICMPVAGRLADLLGGRVVLSAGSILLGISLAVSGLTSSATVFAVAFAGTASLGLAATSHVALSSIIGRWFVKRRGLAMTFVTSGSMAGIGIMVPVTAALIRSIGWRGAMLTFAGAIPVVVLLSAALIGSAPATESSETTGLAAGAGTAGWRKALYTTPFWLLALGFFSCGFSMNLLSTHGVPMLEQHGFTTMTAAYGIGLIGMASIFGTIAIGAASDRLGRQNFLALIYTVRGLGFLGLLFVGREWELYAVALIGGVVWAGSSALTSALTADLFGVEAVGTLFGLMFLSHQIGGAISSYMGGWVYDHFNSYLFPFILTTVLLFGSAYLSYRLPNRGAILKMAATPAGD